MKIMVKNKEIDLNIKNKLTEIYGSNGVGKTTISKAFSSEKNKYFVFNEEYIYKNVYYISDGILKTSTDQRQNLGRIFISERYKYSIDKYQFYCDLKRKSQKEKLILDLIKDSSKNFDIEELKIIQENSENIKKEYENWIKTFLGSVDKKINNFVITDEIIENYLIIKEEINSKILSNDEKNKSCEYFKLKFDENIINNYFSKIKNISLINVYNNFISKDILQYSKNKIDNSFIILIQEYNELIKNKDEYEKSKEIILNVFKNLKISDSEFRNNEKTIYDWIEQGDLIHKKLQIKNNFCLYCGNEKLSYEWMQSIDFILTNKILKVAKELKNKIKIIEDLYKKLYDHINDNIQYNEISETKGLLEKLKSIIYNNNLFEKNIFNKINKFESIILEEFLLLLLEINKIESEKIKASQLSNYVLWKVLEEIFKNLFFVVQNNFFDLVLKKIDENKSKESKEIEKNINELFIELNNMQLEPFNFIIDFHTPKGNTLNKESELIIKNKETNKEIIGFLSSGQRNNLALMYFVSQAKELIKNNKVNTIVIDDPVDGGDFYSYFLIKSFIINYFTSDKYENINVIILTHNFDYLLIQLAGTDKQEINDKIDIFKLNFDGKLDKINKEELNSDNKTIYFKLTEYILSNSIDITISSWIIWTRKIIEEWLVGNLKLNKGLYISDWEQNKCITNNIEDKNLKSYLNNQYYNFIAGRTSYKKMLDETKEILSYVFKQTAYLKDFCNLINNININNYEFKENYFIKKEFLSSNYETNNYLINIAIKASKLMVFDDKNMKIIKDISNYIKHSGNSVSRPIIALEIDSILSKIVNKS